MKNFIHKILFKILVIVMINVELSFFVISPISEAKIKLQNGQNFYSGTQQAELSHTTSTFLSDLLNAIKKLVIFYFTLVPNVFKAIIVGWIEIFEKLLTAVVTLNDDFGTLTTASSTEDEMMKYSNTHVNIESIIFNRVVLLDANIFSNKTMDEYLATRELKDTTSNTLNVVIKLRNATAKWYIILRYICVAFMLILLIYIGIRLALSTVASEKAMYKQMVIGWASGFILLFAMHYIMVAILYTNDTIVDALEPLAQETDKVEEEDLEEYEYGEFDPTAAEKEKTIAELETSLYETVRTKAYSSSLIDGYSGMILYAFLVYYAWRFAIIYFKRMLNIIFLTLLAPPIAVKYAYDKALHGRSASFSKWLKDYIVNSVIQIVHIVIYVSFISIALKETLSSLGGMILVIVLLNFMIKASEILRQMFNVMDAGSGLANAAENNSKPLDAARNIKNTTMAVFGGKAGLNAIKTMEKKKLDLIGNGVFNLYLDKQVRDRNKAFKLSEKDNSVRNEDDSERIQHETDTREVENQREGQENGQETQFDEEDNWLTSGFQERVERIEELENEINNSDNEEENAKRMAEINRIMQEQEEAEDVYMRQSIERLEETNQSYAEIIGRQLDKARDMEDYFEAIYEKDANGEYIKDANGKLIKKGYKKRDTVYGADGYDQYGNHISARKKFSKDNPAYSHYTKGQLSRRRRAALLTRRISGKQYSNWDEFKSRWTWSALLGFDDNPKEKSEFEKELKALKKDVKGLMASYFALPAMGISPSLGMYLFTTGMTSRINIKTRQLKNEPSYETHGTYTFSKIPSQTEIAMQEDAYYALRYEEAQMAHSKRKEKLYRKMMKNEVHVAVPNIKLVAGALTGVRNLGRKYVISSHGMDTDYTQVKSGVSMLMKSRHAQLFSQKPVKKQVKILEKYMMDVMAEGCEEDYKKMFASFAGKVDAAVESAETTQIFAEEIIFGSDESVKLDEQNFFVMNSSNGLRKHLQEAEDLAFSNGERSEEGTKKIVKYIKKNADEILESSIVSFCANQGLDVADIAQPGRSLLSVESADLIRDEFIHKLEDNGIIEHGSISTDGKELGEGLLTRQMVFDKTIQMSSDHTTRAKTKEKISEEITFLACAEYAKESVQQSAQQGGTVIPDFKSETAKKEVLSRIQRRKKGTGSEMVISAMLGSLSDEDASGRDQALDEAKKRIETVASRFEVKSAGNAYISPVTPEAKKAKTKIKTSTINGTRERFERRVYLGDDYDTTSEPSSITEEEQAMVQLLLCMSDCNRKKQYVENKKVTVTPKVKKEMEYYGVRGARKQHDAYIRTRGSSAKVIDLIRNNSFIKENGNEHKKKGEKK